MGKNEIKKMKILKIFKISNLFQFEEKALLHHPYSLILKFPLLFTLDSKN